MTKDVNRSAYTRKIMEIVANIKKQKQEIDKVNFQSKLKIVLISVYPQCLSMEPKCIKFYLKFFFHVKYIMYFIVYNYNGNLHTIYKKKEVIYLSFYPTLKGKLRVLYKNSGILIIITKS